MLFQGVLLVQHLVSRCSPGPSGAPVFQVVERWGLSHLPLQNKQWPLCPTCGFVPVLGQPWGAGTSPCPVPSPGNRSRINPSPEGSPCSLNRNCKCVLTPDWECSECPETQFLQHCAESKRQRGIMRYVGRGEKHSTRLKLLFHVT